ncbi:MAG: hypothetical protein ACKOXB_04370 [Flavobacteriales bacterium]
MRKNIRTILALTFVSGLALTYSCKKTVEYEDLPEVSAADKVYLDSTAKAQALLTNVYTVVHTEVSNVEDQSFKTDGISGLGLPTDPNIEITSEVDSTDKANKYLKKVTLDFKNGVGSDYDKRKYGKIIVTKNGRIDKKGTVCTITFDKFSVGHDHNSMTGTITLENKGFLNGVYTMKLTMTNGTYRTCEGALYGAGPQDGLINMNLDLTIELTVTSGNYKISMSGTQTFDYKNTEYVEFYSTPLTMTDVCSYITDGAKELKDSSGKKKIIDYGDGSCDNKATVIENNKTYRYNVYWL